MPIGWSFCCESSLTRPTGLLFEGPFFTWFGLDLITLVCPPAADELEVAPEAAAAFNEFEVAADVEFEEAAAIAAAAAAAAAAADFLELFDLLFVVVVLG